MDKIVLDIAEKEFNQGLNCVAVSRFKTLEGIIFEVPLILTVFNVLPGNLRSIGLQTGLAETSS